MARYEETWGASRANKWAILTCRPEKYFGKPSMVHYPTVVFSLVIVSKPKNYLLNLLPAVGIPRRGLVSRVIWRGAVLQLFQLHWELFVFGPDLSSKFVAGKLSYVLDYINALIPRSAWATLT